MSFTIDSSGKYTVFIDGTVYSACTTDADCPFQSQCVVNAPWSAFPQMCICSLFYGRTGSQCQDLSHFGWGLFALTLVMIILSLISLLLNCYDIRILRASRVKIVFNAAQINVGLFTLGSFFSFLGSLSYLGELFSNLTLVNRGRGVFEKSPTFFTLTNICVAVMTFSVQVGMLETCLVWAEVADVKRRFDTNVKQFRPLLISYASLLFILSFVFVGLDEIPMLGLIEVAGFLGILVGFAFGYFRMAAAARRRFISMNNLLRTSSRNPGFESEVGIQGLLGIDKRSTNRLYQNKKKRVVLKKKLRNVANIAVLLIFFGIAALVFFVVEQGYGSIDTPGEPVSGFLLLTTWICFDVILLVMSVYSHQQISVFTGRTSRFLAYYNSSYSLGSKTSGVHRKKSFGTLVKHEDAKAGMDEILKRDNMDLRSRFTDFVRSKYADEPLVFYDACTKYEETALTSRIALKGKNVLLQALGAQIVENFIKEDAPKSVNIPDDLRSHILQISAKDEFDERTFEKAKAMALELLKQNFYHQFLEVLKKEEQDQDDDDDDEEDATSIVINIRDEKELNV